MLKIAVYTIAVLAYFTGAGAALSAAGAVATALTIFAMSDYTYVAPAISFVVAVSFGAAGGFIFGAARLIDDWTFFVRRVVRP